MAFHLTPYLTIVIVGFVSFIAVLAFGRAYSNSGYRRPPTN